MKRLDDFFAFFLQQNFAHLSAVEVYDYGSVCSTVLYRSADLQAELFILKPNAGFPRDHRHPDVDSYEYVLSGHVPLIVNGVDVSRGSDGGDGALAVGNMRALYKVSSKDWHSVGDIPNGGAFVSLQLWKNGRAPNSVGLDWEGTPVSETHRRLLRRKDAVWIKTLRHERQSEIMTLNLNSGRSLHANLR